MPLKNSHITVTDQFCGAGGSSQGVRRLSNRYGGGLEVKLALNHWKLAIETHNTNFPDTLHDCTDISACDPRRYHSTDILITSPECTNHSLAKGVKIEKKQMDLFAAGKEDAAAERSRATMWDVCRFAEYHQYNAIIVENVVDARKWTLFDAWLNAMYALGYMHKCVYLNSMHCQPTPQSRDRMYIVFWKKGNKAPELEYTPLAYSPRLGKDVNAIQTWKNPLKRSGKYRQQYVYCCPVTGDVVEPYYYAAFNCIDWSDIGKRIGDREKPLSEKTMKRINFGLGKYGKNPLLIHAAYSDQARGVVRDVFNTGFTHTTVQSQAIVTNPPFIINDQPSTGIDYRVKGSGDLIPTICATHQVKLVTPPFIIKLEHSQRDNNAVEASEALSTQTNRQSSMLVTHPYVKSATDPLATQTTCQGMAFVVENKGTSFSRPISRELQACTSVGHHGLITNDAWNGFISSYYNGSNCVSHYTQPIGTATGTDRAALCTYQEPKIEDCYYRMLKPAEIKLAMAFDKDYTVLGSGRDQVKQLGNAVTPPAMEWLVQQVVESLK